MEDDDDITKYWNYKNWKHIPTDRRIKSIREDKSLIVESSKELNNQFIGKDKEINGSLIRKIAKRHKLQTNEVKEIVKELGDLVKLERKQKKELEEKELERVLKLLDDFDEELKRDSEELKKGK